MSDYDKQKWQAEQEANDAAQSAYRDKMARARERSAANARRKIARLHAKLTELGHISDFEDEFGESVLERLEKFGSAFHDLEKGRAGDALSAAQKQVVARMNRKVKELKRKQADGAPDDDPDRDYVRTADRWKRDGENKPRSSFKSKRKARFTPRVRHIEDDFEDETPTPPTKVGPPKLAVVEAAPAASKLAPYIPEYTPPPNPSAKKRPFLRIVKD
jgi:hypothetical protein